MPEDTKKKKTAMKNSNSNTWQFNKQISISVIVQLTLLASLIIGSWVNLQRQLDLLQRDVSMLLQCNRKLEESLERLSDKSVAYEYRLRAIEKFTTETGDHIR